MPRLRKDNLRRFHQARWDEEMLFELSVPGERGVIPPVAEPEIVAEVGAALDLLPENMRRETPPALPEVSQPRVVRHYARLSQETMGVDVTPDISMATCTMKYSPKVQEHVAARHPGLTQVHPLQPDETIQGILEMLHSLEAYLAQLSGLPHFSFQPGGGAQAIFTNACIVRAYHASRGDTRRDEIITTIFSHPANAGATATAGYKVITLMPDESGLPRLEALKNALGERTAGLFITNPEDTGIYNPHIDQFVAAAHDAGALCVYDQANLNAVLGIARAAESGFDLCHFNLHKTFSAPHGCMGPAAGALGASDRLEPFLPVPRIVRDETGCHLDFDRPRSIGRVRSFLGNLPVMFKAYAWIRTLGAEGLREAAKCSVLNSNYLEDRVRRIPGVSIPYARGKRRLEQVRFSWESLKAETGVGTEDLKLRVADFGLQHYWTSHHPWVVPEPFTLEPCESYSVSDLDEYAGVLAEIAREARQDPEFIRASPHRCAIHRVREQFIDDPERIAITWRQYLKKYLPNGEARDPAPERPAPAPEA